MFPDNQIDFVEEHQNQFDEYPRETGNDSICSEVYLQAPNVHVECQFSLASWIECQRRLRQQQQQQNQEEADDGDNEDEDEQEVATATTPTPQKQPQKRKTTPRKTKKEGLFKKTLLRRHADNTMVYAV